MSLVVRYVMFELLIFACNTLPPRFLYWIALRLSDLNYFLLDRKGCASVKKNLRHVFPDASRKRILYETRWVFRNFGKYLTEFFRFRQFDDEFFSQHVSIDGFENVEKALAKGNGCIALSAHLSNWELGAAGLINRAGDIVHAVFAQHSLDMANRLFLREREAVGVKVIYMESAARPVLQALKKNEIVCILGDRDPTGQGHMVNYFGRPCRFPQGPGRFALKSGAAIVPAFVNRRTNDSFCVTFMPEIPIPEHEDKEERVRLFNQKFAHIFEEKIRKQPEEWGAFYNVWEEDWEI